MNTTDPTPDDSFAEAMLAASLENNPYRDPHFGEFRAGAEWARAHLAEQEPHSAARDARVRAEAIAPVLALHRAMPLYDLATECKTPDDEDHADAHHSESDDGELLCMDSPAGTACEHCRDTDGSLVDHPCPTVRAVSIEQETQP